MKRNPDESFEDYQNRRKSEKKNLKIKIRGVYSYHSNTKNNSIYRKDVRVFEGLKKDLAKDDFYKLCLEIIQKKTESHIIIQKAQQYVDTYLKAKQSIAPTTDC